MCWRTTAYHPAMRYTLMAVALTLGLTACGGQRGYSSAADVATAAGCQQFHEAHHVGVEGTGKPVVTVGTCSYNGHPETVMWFESADAATGWRSLGAQHHSRKVLFDGQWMIRCDASADCAAFKVKVGGSFE